MVSKTEIIKAVGRMKSNKVPGPDGNPTEMLEIFVAQRPKVLVDLENGVLKTGNFPREYKIGILVLLRKPDKIKDDPSSFRQLCLLNTAGKLLEAIIASRLSQFIGEGGLLPPNQHRFRPKHSTTNAIDEVVSIARVEMNKTLKARQLCILMP